VIGILAFIFALAVAATFGYLAIREEIRSNREAVAAAATPSTTVATGSVR
jgi:hypothetical protein